MPYQMKVVAAALATVTGLVDERADNVNAEPAEGALFWRRVQIRLPESERIERRPVVDKTNPEVTRPPSERHDDISISRMRFTTVRHGVGEEFVENDQKPRALVIWQTANERELVDKGLKPSELGMLAM